MNVDETVNEIVRRNGAPKAPRASYGQWNQPAMVVAGLVEKGFNVTEAVRQVIRLKEFTQPSQAFAGIRARYYALHPRKAKTTTTTNLDIDI